MRPSVHGVCVLLCAAAACSQAGGGSATPTNGGGQDSGAAELDAGQDAPPGSVDSGPSEPAQGAGAAPDTGIEAEGGSSVPPPPAAAAGYTLQTLGPAVTLGGHWHPFTFYGTNPADVVASQNADGSLTVVGRHDYGAQVSTASATGAAPYFTGMAFGGGGYFEITMAIGGPALFWATTSRRWRAFRRAIRRSSSGPPRPPASATGSSATSQSSTRPASTASRCTTGTARSAPATARAR